ncbi:glycosyltransferase family 4 protein [Cryobacterium sp. TMB1-7]|uniref:glycosyltransferase family 4 protein n=1 Tax=Cryobacterium sp. TMB1-7 TaxID=2555866 RepID=UPI0010694698|nr:glycosyltransferase family 4 protein [Cryobacterium sp. TMB1-7]TFC61642.1 glycosyltransferase [Cryobacterium sp. TMB1-7]
MRIAIIHPWLPQYRKRFFELLVHEAGLKGVEVHVYYGETPREWRARNDSVSSPSARLLRTWFFSIRGRDVSFKDLRPVRTGGPYDLIIAEQAVRNIETYLLVAGRRKTPVAFWGHGRTFTVRVSRNQENLKQWLTRRGLWFLAYTKGGAQAVVEAGFPSDRVTVVQNSIDTTVLKQSIEDMRVDEISAFNSSHDLKGKTALFVGGLDASKRIQFLLEAGEIAHTLDSDFRLIIAGDGDERDVVERFQIERPWLIFLGPVFGSSKAVAMAASQAMAMPGRVGLVAVDAFAARLPVITTDWPWHAPEFEYLEDGVNAVVTKDDTHAYATGLDAVFRDHALLLSLKANCGLAGEAYSVEVMVQNFLHGICRALEVGRR